MNRRALFLAALVAIATACAAESASIGTPATTGPSGSAARSDGAVFISPDGDDAAAGTAGEPVRSLERALSIAPADGTVVFTEGVHEGGHQLEGVSAVTITGLPGAILDGGGIEPLGIYCDGCTDLTIENLEIRGFSDIGVGATASTRVTFRALEVHGNGNAVQLVDWELEGYGIHIDFSTFVTIESNEVHDNGPDPAIFPDRILGTGIDTFGNSDVTIRGNRSYANHGGGILVEDSFRVAVEANEVFDNDLDASIDEWWDGGLWLDGGGDVVVTDNVFRGNRGPGIEISDEDRQDPTGYVLTNNVSTGNYFGIFIWNFGTAALPPPEIVTLNGNDFSGNDRLDVWIEPSL